MPYLATECLVLRLSSVYVAGFGGSSTGNLRYALILDWESCLHAGTAAKGQAAKKKGTTLPLTAFLKPEVTSWADDDPENDVCGFCPSLHPVLLQLAPCCKSIQV